jgi:DNA ligase-1
MSKTVTFKPLLSSAVDFTKIPEWTHPDGSCMWVMSPKLDGIRALPGPNGVVSRKMLMLPSKRVQAMFARPEFQHLDGELIYGDPCDPDVYNKTYSAVMAEDAEVDCTFYVFDHTERPDDDYEFRFKRLAGSENVIVVPQTPVYSEAEARAFDEKCVDLGYEGSMLRRWSGKNSHYKFGRSSPKEGILLKLKETVDFECEIIGMEEEMQNNNVATLDAFGRTKRSSHQENKVGKGRLGKFVLRDILTGVEFKSRGRLNAAQLQAFWDAGDTMLGQIVVVRKMKYGEQDLPRQPRVVEVKGPRSRIDL